MREDNPPNMGCLLHPMLWQMMQKEINDENQNDVLDNGNGATGLMRSQDDSSNGLNWEGALAWVEQKNMVNYLGYRDWRLPNVKELQSLVDYTRSPNTTGSAAIDPLFNITWIVNEAGFDDFPSG